MPKTTQGRPKRRTKAQAAEHTLANRVAASLDLSTTAPAAAPKAAVKPAAVSAPPAPKAPPAKAAPAAESGGAGLGLLNTGFSQFSAAVTSMQDLARETAVSVSDSRLNAANSVVAFQQKVLEMAHANLSETFAAARRIVQAGNVGDAIKTQSSYAQDTLKTLTAQAAELRSLSAKLAEEARAPIAAHWAKSLDRMKASLGR